MGYILTVYSQSAYKEYLLPAVINANYSIVLYKELFHLSEDVALEMENVDGKWRILPGDTAALVYMDSRKEAYGQDLADSDIYSLSLPAGEKVTIIVKVSDRFFRVFDKFSLEGVDSITIGTAPGNGIRYDFMHVVSDVHAAILRKGSDFIVEDRSRNGLFVNARRVAGSKRLEYGDLINVFGLSIVFLKDTIAVDTTSDECQVQKLKPRAPAADTALEEAEGAPYIFHRAPRYLPKLADDTVTIEAPPAPKDANQEPLLLTIGPSITMAIPMVLGCMMAIWASGESAGIFMYTGLVTAISSALIGTIWALVNIRHTKKKLRENELKRFEVYGEYLITCANQVQEKYNQNTEALRQLYTDPSACCQYTHASPQLWNRNRTHEDFLLHRLGLGDIPFQVTVDIPKERFSMLNDSLSTKSKMIKENYTMLREVPVCADLGHKLIGIIGGRGRKGCYPVMYNLTAQLAASNCYTDVKMAFIYDRMKNEVAGRWEFARWLPHTWSEDKRVRYVADNKTDASDVFYEIAKALRMRAEMDAERRKEAFRPHYVLFIEDVSVLEGELIAKFLLDGRDLGVTVVLLAESYEELPNICEHIIENTSRFQGMYAVTDPVKEQRPIRFDKVSAGQLESFARALSCIQVNEIETGGELPGSLTFFDMYGVHTLKELNVEARWRKNRTYDSIKGLLGQKSGGASCYLDVHEKYHGPHGLIAGTTGSGKSETLQTYMLSLAINYSPDDVGFFVIDYKGGGMANLFSDLPHLIGQISNLSGNQVHRAMVSIKSENMRRQRVFNEHGVNNINNYTRLYKNGEAALPVPHMFIIIDEFAELKREEPEFMKELISVAQVGRSLGVHLILATQKPSGTVDDNIWSNAKFRLCLRVQDQQDSKDMLHRPEAAYITQAGRCYLQVGNDELFELFQSGWSGAPYEEDGDSLPGSIAMMLSVTGKAALVGSHTKIKRKEQENVKWINALLDVLDAAAEGAEGIASGAEDAVRLGSLAERFFEEAPGMGVDYPRSDYNLQRVKDLTLTYAAAQEQGWASREERAALILDLSDRSGRKLPEMKKQSQLEAVVGYLGALARENGYVHNLQLWLPVLPEKLYLEDLKGYKKNAFDGEKWPRKGRQWTLEAFMGLCDDPVNQAQMPMILDFANNGNHAVCGTVVSGKSTFLVTLLYSLVMRYTPQALNIYALDFSSKMLSAFEGLAHVGGVLYENDEEKISKFFTMMAGILEERKALLRGGNYKQYVQASGAEEPELPAILVAVDNYSAFREKTEFAYDDFMLKLSKEGVSCGIYLMITAMGFSSSEIPSRLGENLRTVVCLEMTDKFAYNDALRTMHLDVLPEENVKGRGLTKVGDSYLEFQTALPLEADDDFARTNRVREACARLNARWTGRQARRIPEIPEKPAWQEFSQLEEVAAMQKLGERLPIGYDHANASVYGIDLRRTYCYLISGKARTGKTNLMREMLMAASGMETDVTVIDFAQEYAALAGDVGARHVGTDQELFQYMLDLQKEVVGRNKFKKECVKAGDTDEEIYEKMGRYRRKMILVGDLPEFVEHTARPADGLEPMAPFLSNLLDKGANHNIYWFACMNSDDHARVAGQSVYDLYIREKAGIHFGGNVEDQRVMDFDYVKYSDRAKPLKPGVGLLPQRDDETTRKVIVPLCRR